MLPGYFLAGVIIMRRPAVVILMVLGRRMKGASL
jgi:hypothetical protein